MNVSPKVVCIIQARTGSTRLPNKVLLPVYNKKTLLDMVFERVAKAKSIAQIIFAIPEGGQDLILSDYLKKSGYQFHIGSESNVLDRFYECSNELKADFIVRICADRPLMQFELIDQAVELVISSGADYASNFHLGRTFPIGLDVEVLSFSALKKTWIAKTSDYQNEHVTPYIYQNCDHLFDCKYFSRQIDEASHYRLTVDEPQDLKMISTLIKKRPELLTASVDKLICILKEEPEILSLNNGVMQNDKL